MTPEQLKTLRAGDIIHIGPGSGVACKNMYARYIRNQDWDCWTGMTCLEVREVDEAGDQWRGIGGNRMAYVAIAGLRLVKPFQPATPPQRRPTNAGPARIPRPRTSPEKTTGRTR